MIIFSHSHQCVIVYLQHGAGKTWETRAAPWAFIFGTVIIGQRLWRSAGIGPHARVNSHHWDGLAGF